jgi:hypothetical protein
MLLRALARYLKIWIRCLSAGMTTSKDSMDENVYQHPAAPRDPVQKEPLAA